MEEKFRVGLFPVSNGREEIIPCDGYEVISDNGKFYVVKKLPQYPKTYAECAEVMGWASAYIDGYNGKFIKCLQKLFICRDAYWKIAGEELGLGKPWRPDWLDTKTQKYCIYYVGNEIKKQPMLEVHHLLAFPTKEMRDAFYENFKELIEACKELL